MRENIVESTFSFGAARVVLRSKLTSSIPVHFFWERGKKRKRTRKEEERRRTRKTCWESSGNRSCENESWLVLMELRSVHVPVSRRARRIFVSMTIVVPLSLKVLGMDCSEAHSQAKTAGLLEGRWTREMRTKRCYTQQFPCGNPVLECSSSRGALFVGSPPRCCVALLFCTVSRVVRLVERPRTRPQVALLFSDHSTLSVRLRQLRCRRRLLTLGTHKQRPSVVASLPADTCIM